MPDGVRDLAVRYAGHRTPQTEGRETLVIVMKDEAYPLEVELSYRAIPECDLIERSTRIVNRGEADIVLENAQSAAWVIPIWRITASRT